MSRLIDIDDARFWGVLFDEACVEGNQAERIKTELEKIVAFDMEKVVAELESARNCHYSNKWDEEGDLVLIKSIESNIAIDIVKKGGVE